MQLRCFDGLNILLGEDLPGALLLGHGGEIFGGVGEGDAFIHSPAAQLAEQDPELVAGGFAFALGFQGDDGGLVVAAEDLAHGHRVELRALLEGKAVVAVHAGGNFTGVLFVPPFVYIGEGHIEFIIDGHISEPLQGFLGFDTGGEGADADTVFPGLPWLCSVAGQLRDTAAAVGALAVFPGLCGLALAADWAESSRLRQIRAAFDTVHFSSLPFGPGYATING